MLTIFSCPKSFDGHIGIIQRNAIHSWTLLNPKPEIILFGDENGVSEICNEFDLINAKEVERNENGTPLISSLFYEGQSLSSQKFMCYINSDIILLSNFMKSFHTTIGNIDPPFLLTGRRWDVEINEEIFFNKGWENRIKELIERIGTIKDPLWIDYFIFPKGLFREIPNFILGRPRWDNWLIYHAIARKILVVDLTPQNLMIHQNHDYSHIDQEAYEQSMNPEWEANEKLLGKWWPRYYYSIWDSDFVFTKKGIAKNSFFKKFNSKTERKIWLISIVIKDALPFSYPILYFGKSLYILLSQLKKIFY